MGRSRYRVVGKNVPHFITCTVLNWIPLFTRPQTAEIVLEAIQHRQAQSLWRVYGYVLLENHLHMVVQADDLAGEVARFKSYTARRLIDCLEACQAERLLKQLAFFRKAHKHDRDYQVWEEGAHPQAIENEQVLRQKLEYIHQNPVKRGYVDDPAHWRYSSARNYAGQPGLVPVFKEWL
ncbi:MAG: transposase [Methylococcaceae bacterium]|nr:MAG: transposase [Methylococcaceae bacterium]